MEPRDPVPPDLVSFVVPAHDEEAVLGPTLEALIAAARAAGPPFEIVVADDASTDRTAEVAREHGARVVRVEHRQISRARNAGARAARGGVLVFVDADTLVPADTLRAALARLDAGWVGGGARTAFDGGPRGVRWTVGAFVALLKALRLASGCFLFCRRADFDAVGGFDESLYAGEELRLSRALGRRGTFRVLPDPVVTSSRKIRTHTVRELLLPALRPLWKGRGAFGQREGLDVWYGPRRADPGANRDVGSGR